MRDRSVLQQGAEETLAGGSEPRGYKVFVGGFPCQDLSIAGRQAGLWGNQSGLHAEYLELIRLHRPDWIVTENVGHTWRRWVPQLRRELDRIGYASLPLRVRASDLGANHERSRVFLVANANGELLRELSRWWVREGREMAKELSWSWHWTPGRLGETYGLSDGLDRRRALGNSVIPQIAEIIARGIREVSE